MLISVCLQQERLQQPLYPRVLDQLHSQARRVLLGAIARVRQTMDITTDRMTKWQETRAARRKRSGGGGSNSGSGNDGAPYSEMNGKRWHGDERGGAAATAEAATSTATLLDSSDGAGLDMGGAVTADVAAAAAAAVNDGDGLEYNGAFVCLCLLAVRWLTCDRCIGAPVPQTPLQSNGIVCVDNNQSLLTQCVLLGT